MILVGLLRNTLTENLMKKDKPDAEEVLAT
jgi:hypothetical protein